MKKQFLEIGKIVATHGIKGEVRVQPWCDDAELLAEMDRLWLDPAGKNELHIEHGRVQKNVVVLKLAGVDTVEAAQLMRNKILFINRSQLELSENSYFIQDLIGLTVYDADQPDKQYGRLTEVFQTGANDVYEVTDSAGLNRLVPAIPEVIVETDIDGEKMLIRPLKGLFEDED